MHLPACGCWVSEMRPNRAFYMPASSTFLSSPMLLRPLPQGQARIARGLSCHVLLILSCRVCDLDPRAVQVIGLKWYNMQNERWFDNLTDTVEYTSSPEPVAGSPNSQAGDSSTSASSGADSSTSPTRTSPTGGEGRSRAGAAASSSMAMGNGAPVNSKAGHRPQRGGSSTDYMWQAHISELQATADRLARGIGVRILGLMGSEDANLNHPDYEFFKIRS
jgi:hypothetical protein